MGFYGYIPVPKDSRRTAGRELFTWVNFNTHSAMRCLRRLYGILLATAVVAALFYTRPALAVQQQLLMSQQIGTQSCVITTVVQPDGSFTYILPPGCGTLIVPEPPVSQNQIEAPVRPRPHVSHGSPLSAPATADAGKLILQKPSVYLSAPPAKQPDGGYVLLTSPGKRYTFRLEGDSPALMMRSFEIVSINDNFVTVRFRPEGSTVPIALGQPERINLAYEDSPDIKITLMQLNSDGSVLLRVQFLAQPTLATGAARRRDELIAAGIASTAAAISVTLFTQQWLFVRKGRVPLNWWVEHVHDPVLDEKFLRYQTTPNHIHKQKVLT